MYSTNTSSSNVVNLNDYIDREYLTIDQLVTELNEIAIFPVSASNIWALLSKHNLVIESFSGHRLTEESRAFTTRTYIDGQLQILWKRSLINLLSQNLFSLGS